MIARAAAVLDPHAIGREATAPPAPRGADRRAEATALSAPRGADRRAALSPVPRSVARLRLGVAVGSIAVAVVLAAAPAGAWAAAPANDAPTGATGFTGVTAENGPVPDRQGLADLVEATPDAGVPRCLGSDSFARTVWFTVPAATTPQRVTVEASGASGGSADVPDLAAFVQPTGAAAAVVVEPQACDGKAAGGAQEAPDAASAVDLRVPAGHAVLIQVGRSKANTERVVVDLHTDALEAAPGPVGDEAGVAPSLPREQAVSIDLAGATLTPEDPAEPRCAASGTVWRRVVAKRTGTQTVTAAGTAVGTLTAFVGTAPSGDDAVDCVNRVSAAAPLALAFPAKRGDVLWLRLGTDGPAKAQTGTLQLVSPPAKPRLGVSITGPRAATRQARPRVSVSVAGAAVTGLRVRLQRRVGRRFVTVATGAQRGTIRSGRRARVTLTTKRRLVRGTYRILATARAVDAPKAIVRRAGRPFRLR